MLDIKIKGSERYLCGYEGETLARLRSFSEVAGNLKGAAFIVASGPSVAEFPIEMYRRHPFVAMNGSILACNEHGVSPYFYLCDDESFAKDRGHIALEGVRTAKHIGMSLAVLSRLYEIDKDCLKNASIFLLERANRFLDKPHLSHRKFAWAIRKDSELLSQFSLFSQSANRIGFSKNMDRGYFVARTIPYVALQLCYQLGCHRVFLVGVDMTPSKGRFYERGEAAAPTSLDESYKNIILPSFQFMKRNIVEKDIFEVYNLSLESRIPDKVVKKVGLDALPGYCQEGLAGLGCSE